jgi:hypothetical protein
MKTTIQALIDSVNQKHPSKLTTADRLPQKQRDATRRPRVRWTPAATPYPVLDVEEPGLRGRRAAGGSGSISS